MAIAIEARINKGPYSVLYAYHVIFARITHPKKFLLLQNVKEAAKEILVKRLYEDKKSIDLSNDHS